MTEAVECTVCQALYFFPGFFFQFFIVPAAVGPYTIRPHGPAVGAECATLKAYVRT